MKTMNILGQKLEEFVDDLHEILDELDGGSLDIRRRMLDAMKYNDASSENVKMMRAIAGTSSLGECDGRAFLKSDGYAVMKTFIGEQSQWALEALESYKNVGDFSETAFAKNTQAIRKRQTIEKSSKTLKGWIIPHEGRYERYDSEHDDQCNGDQGRWNALSFLSDTEYPSCSVLPGDEPAFYQDLGVITEREDSRRVAELANLMKETYDGSRTFEVSREDRRKIWDRCESNNRNYK